MLEMEQSALKEKVAVILEKSQNDDRLITALRGEVAALRRGARGQQQQQQQPSASPKAAGAGRGATEPSSRCEASVLFYYLRRPDHIFAAGHLGSVLDLMAKNQSQASRPDSRY